MYLTLLIMNIKKILVMTLLLLSLTSCGTTITATTDNNNSRENLPTNNSERWNRPELNNGEKMQREGISDLTDEQISEMEEIKELLDRQASWEELSEEELELIESFHNKIWEWKTPWNRDI